MLIYFWLKKCTKIFLWFAKEYVTFLLYVKLWLQVFYTTMKMSKFFNPFYRFVLFSRICTTISASLFFFIVSVRKLCVSKYLRATIILQTTMWLLFFCLSINESNQLIRQWGAAKFLPLFAAILSLLLRSHKLLLRLFKFSQSKKPQLRYSQVNF